MKKNCVVTFEPAGRRISVPKGTSLLDAARSARVWIASPCGGQGVCGKCFVSTEPRSAVAVKRSKARVPASERRTLVLACRSHVRGDVIVHVRGGGHYKITDVLPGVGRLRPRSPAIRKEHVRLRPRDNRDLRSDLQRLASRLRYGSPSRASLGALRKLSACLRRQEGDCTAVSDDGDILAVEDGDTTSVLFGAALDIGTTTVVGRLVDLRTGLDVAVAARSNPQARYGDDVISRIAHVSKERKGLDRLHGAILDCLNDILDELCQTARTAASSVYAASVAGNTAMIHLFLGIDPSTLAQAPYAPVVVGPFQVTAAELGLNLLAEARVRTLPCVAGFLGADAVGVALASRIHRGSATKLAIDIGTNGEIVLSTGDKLLACSTAAGPAFEGARIQHGMRASPGAISSVRVGQDLEWTTVDGEKPLGICGSGLIDAVAEFLRAGIIDPSGRLRNQHELAGQTPKLLARRVRVGKSGNHVLLAGAKESATGRSIVLTQRDIRETQLAKAAVASGIEILLKEAGISATDVSQVLLAGAFGNFIRPDQAVRLGLLPSVSLERVRFIGNAACEGAKHALLSKRLRREAARIAGRISYIELAARPDFQDTFAANIPFPAED